MFRLGEGKGRLDQLHFTRVFTPVLRQSLIVAFQRGHSLSARMRRSLKFMSFVYKLYQNQGPKVTVE